MNKIIKISFVLVVVAIAGYNIYSSSYKSKSLLLSDLLSANVEALASGEGPTPCGGPKNDNGMCLSSNTVNCKDLYGCQ